VTQPAVAILEVSESTTSYVLKGTSIPGATVSIATPGREQPYRVSADAEGNWAAEVKLHRDKNQFDITATDPETGKSAETAVQRVITVPFLAIEAPTLTLDQPADGATFENGAIRVEGTTTNAETVEIKAAYVGPAVGEPAVPAGSPAPSSSAAPAPTPPAPAPLMATIDDDGAFAAPLELTTGRWLLTVTASSKEGKTIALSRTVTVAYKGVTLVSSVKGGSAWVKIWVDGKVDDGLGQAGATKRNGDVLTFTGKTSIEVRTGSSGVTQFTLNGTPLGALGRSGVPENWLFEPPDPPRKTGRT